MIIGRDVTVEARQAQYRSIALKVEKASKQSALREDISFGMKEGEILGLWGLMGSGRTELVHAMLGLVDRRRKHFPDGRRSAGENSTPQAAEPLRIHHRKQTCRRIISHSTDLEKHY